MRDFDFRDLFILDLANNHQGRMEHATRIIRECGAVARENGIRAALKFQFRNLDTFIHPSHRAESANRHVKRFLHTRLRDEEFKALTDEVRAQAMVTISTPFDEDSVELLLRLDLDVVKVASCSATDWPLLERVAECGKPVIFSTGGLTVRQVDDLVSFFDHRGVHYAIMHCVSIYPTPHHQLELNRIEMFRARYPGRVIGFSTHEQPEDTAPVQIAVAKGAEIFERHVGISTDSITLNAYSSTPRQLDTWMQAWRQARSICGSRERERSPLPEEQNELLALRRGVYAKVALKAGVELTLDDVYFAMPCENGQLEAGRWKEGSVLKNGVRKDTPLMTTNVEIAEDVTSRILYEAIHTIKAMLNESRIALGPEFRIEFSHHYGLSRFRDVGAVIIDCVNREYCKKLIVQLPGQSHPLHFHKRKEETFQVLSGILEAEIDHHRRTLHPGDTLLVQQGVWHRFWTDTGVIFEEISSTHYKDDSFYADKAINRLERSERKTVVQHWGRYQLGNQDTRVLPSAFAAATESA